MKRKTQRHFFTLREDKALKKLVKRIGVGNWSEISKKIPGLSPKQCRDRYMNYLKSDLTFTEWTQSDNELLEDLFKQYGPKWALIANIMKNRSENEIKNHWYRHKSKHARAKNKESDLKKFEEINQVQNHKNDVDNQEAYQNTNKNKSDSTDSLDNNAVINELDYFHDRSDLF